MLSMSKGSLPKLASIPWRYVLAVLATVLIIEFSIRSWTVSCLVHQSWDHLRNLTFPSTPFSHHLPEEYLAVCVTIRDQSYNLPEWLRHHYYHMNISRFYILDDASNPPLSTFTDLGIPQSALTFDYYPDKKHEKRQVKQNHMYEECMTRYKYNHTWIAIFDIDEFFEIKTSESMESILRELETHGEIGALAVNWKVHTSAGLLTRPESARKGFDTCIDIENGDPFMDNYVKSIVRAEFWGGVSRVHQFPLTNNTITVGEDWKWIGDNDNGQRIPITRNRIVLHHYMTRSKQEFQEKMDRWKEDIPRNWDLWDRLEGTAHVKCPEMARYDP